jgi:predicted nucleotidyltransferase
VALDRDDIRDRILRSCPGARLIVLFGSRARGDARPDSDYDLLVVAPPDRSANARAAEIRLALWEIPAAFDLVVLNPRDFDVEREFHSGVVYRALKEGVVLHEAA